jgi:hypothetical protein
MRLSLLVFVFCIGAVVSSCSGVDESTGHVRLITLEPAPAAAGERARIYVDLYDPYLYPGIPGAGPRVTLQVDGGMLAGREWSTVSDPLGRWQDVDGTSIIVNPASPMYWTLPEIPGTYKLTVGFDGNKRTKRVEVR